MALGRWKCIFATHMRIWIAVFLISLFAFQALPVMVLGKSCAKAKVGVTDTAGEQGADDEGAVPESGKLKKGSPALEDYYLAPSCQRIARIRDVLLQDAFAPVAVARAATGHAELHTPPPDRH